MRLLRLLSHVRLWVFVVLALVVFMWHYLTDPAGGAETLLRLQWWAWMLVGAGAVYALRRAFIHARSEDAYAKAMESPTGAGLVFLGLCLLTGLLFLAVAGKANAGELPHNAAAYLPMLKAEQRAHWPGAPVPSALAAQVEQETCVSLRSAKCWSPRAELKTSREYGFGLGQLTVTSRFDNFKEARKLDASLRDWQWGDRYDARLQLRTLVLMDRSPYMALARLVPDERERMAMAFSAYNGGLGGVMADRRLCATVAGCDPVKWFGNVEAHSLKARTKTQGYGQSFYDINRGYVRAVMYDRRQKYVRSMEQV